MLMVGRAHLQDTSPKTLAPTVAKSAAMCRLPLSMLIRAAASLQLQFIMNMSSATATDLLI